MAIIRTQGFKTDDGRMFSTLKEAAGHLYAKRLREAMSKHSGSVFGVNTVLEYSREIEAVLREYNAELDKLEGDANDQL